MESYTMCTQIIGELGNTYTWMGLFMFGLGISLGLIFSKVGESETLK